MLRYVFSDDVETITLRRNLKIAVTPEPIEREVDMISGRTVKDVVGYKDVLSLPVGYLSLEDNNKLCQMITRNHGLLTISYTDATGDHTEKFIVKPPTWTSFKYDDDGVAVWEGVTIQARTVEVVK